MSWDFLAPPLPLAPVLADLLTEARVVEVQLITTKRPHSFLGREVSPEAQLLARTARYRHREHGYGFWDAMLSGLNESDAQTRRAVLQWALRHDTESVVSTDISKDQFVENLDTGLYNGLPPRQLTSLSSRVQTIDERILHLPMLDLGVPSAELALDVLDALPLPCAGVLISSGHSFHYIGSNPVTEYQLIDFLAHAQLLAPLIDQRWAAHQIINRWCGLRISTDTERHTIPNSVVARSHQ